MIKVKRLLMVSLICHTKFAEDANKCSLVKGITTYCTTLCPTCHQWVNSSEVEK